MGGIVGDMITPTQNDEDRHVLEKHQLIYPGEEELDTIMELVEHTEHALKDVSDGLMSKGNEGGRELVGVARVGDLAKGVLLSGDRTVEVVIMCRQKPTVELLETICESLKPKMEEISANTGHKYMVSSLVEEAGLTVTLQEGETPFYTVLVKLTSKQHRDFEEKEDTETSGGETQGEFLDRDKCLKALAQLRHSKWFSAMAAPLHSCVESIRIFKDMSKRELALAKLGSWAMELIVERVLATAMVSLSPSLAVLRVLEALSAGLVLEDGPGIRDPCEKSQEDVLSHLTSQDRENITRFSQDAVRKIHYRKIHQVLAMKRLILLPQDKEEVAKEEAENKKLLNFLNGKKEEISG